MKEARPTWTPENAAHLLMRATWSARPGEVKRAVDEGLEATLGRLLSDEADDDLFPEPEVFTSGRLAEMRREVAGLPRESAGRMQASQRLGRAERLALRELQGWWLARLRFSPCPLREVMTLFWHGHFATSFVKVRMADAMLWQNQLFRDLGLGRFEDLVLAVSRDPAMMRYLDVTGSSRRQPNENFARELMELFTLGEGHYSEADVREAARAFTGWRLEPATGRARFIPARHDHGEKTLLGVAGRHDAAACVKILCSQPRCARFITGKIWRHFAGMEAQEPTLRRLEREFSSTGGSIRAVLRAVFTSPEFYSPGLRGRRIKGPVEWLVGTLKLFDLPPLPTLRMTSALRELGQELFAPPNVKGWEEGRAWISATTLLARERLALELFRPDVERLAPGLREAPADQMAEELGKCLMPCNFSPALKNQALAALSEAGDGQGGGSTERILALTRFFLTHPEYQLT